MVKTMDDETSRENRLQADALTDETSDAGFQPEAEGETPTPFFPVSEGKLITMYLLSMGFYGIYWFYKNWKLQQPMMDKKIYPVWRAIFSIFFAYSLFKRVDQKAGNLQKSQRFSPGLMATLFITTVIIGQFLEKVPSGTIGLDQLTNTGIIVTSLVLFVLSTYPLVKVQGTMNRLNDDILGTLNHKFSMWNYVLIALGAILWSLIILGIIFESLGLVPTA